MGSLRRRISVPMQWSLQRRISVPMMLEIICHACPETGCAPRDRTRMESAVESAEEDFSPHAVESAEEEINPHAVESAEEDFSPHAVESAEEDFSPHDLRDHLPCLP